MAMSQSETAVRTEWRHIKIKMKKATRDLLRHLAYFAAGCVGFGAGVATAYVASKPKPSLAFLAAAYIIGGLSFVIASIASQSLSCDYMQLKKLRARKLYLLEQRRLIAKRPRLKLLPRSI